MRFENKKGPKRKKKKKKNAFCKLESFCFFLYYFFISSFPFDFKDDF